MWSRALGYDHWALSSHEEEMIMNDLRAEERADATPDIETPALAPGYVRCEAGMHPDHDEAVVFTPGQQLPGWAAKALLDQHPVATADGIYLLAKNPVRRR